MKQLNYIFGFILIVVVVVSCKSLKTIPVTDTIPISEYTAYVFRLCEYRNTLGNKRYFLCDKPCTATDVQANDSIQVIEELYAFRSNTNSEDIIYITSKSDKYILEDRGIFNDSLYKKHIVVSDFEYVYFGKLTNNVEISFINATEALSFHLKPVIEECRFLVDSIYSKTAVKNTISNKKISLFDLFKVPVQFIETPRTLVHSRKNLEPVTILELKDGKLNFKGDNKTYTESQRKRLKYHPIYGPTHEATMQKIIRDSVALKN